MALQCVRPLPIKDRETGEILNANDPDIIIHTEYYDALRWYPQPAHLAEVPYEAVLISTPDNEHARENMTVGNVYVVTELAGSCVMVSTNIPGDRTLIWRGRLEKL
jgi:hypothetical protein